MNTGSQCLKLFLNLSKSYVLKKNNPPMSILKTRVEHVGILHYLLNPNRCLCFCYRILTGLLLFLNLTIIKD